MISKSMLVGQFVIAGPVGGKTDAGAPAPITQLGFSAVGGDVTVETLANNSFKITGNAVGVCNVTFVAKNSLNQNISEVLALTVALPVATQLDVPVSDPQ